MHKDDGEDGKRGMVVWPKSGRAGRWRIQEKQTHAMRELKFTEMGSLGIQKRPASRGEEMTKVPSFIRRVILV